MCLEREIKGQTGNSPAVVLNIFVIRLELAMRVEALVCVIYRVICIVRKLCFINDSLYNSK